MSAVDDLTQVVFTRRNGFTVAAMVTLALVGLALPDGTLSYAAYLTLFSVWMVGFVLTVVDLLRLRSESVTHE